MIDYGVAFKFDYDCENNCRCDSSSKWPFLHVL